MSELAQVSMGWVPDYPDFRDYSEVHSEVKAGLKLKGQQDSVRDMLTKARVRGKRNHTLPSKEDLRQWCSPIENQFQLNSCTAHACVGLVEYFEMRAFNKYLDASRLFLYKVTRNLLRWEGDDGAFLRSTMGALVLFGVPPEKYWPYQTDQREFNKEPTPFCYAFAQNYQGIQYYRLDTPGVTPQELLGRIKTGLAAGLPSMFGFSVYPSYKQSFTRDGQIPYPTKGEKAENGHAVMAVGYDDMKKIKNTNPGAKETRGALLIRNSWGPIWGEDGYGWLPYEYILHELAMDWWAVLKNEWINTNQFGL